MSKLLLALTLFTLMSCGTDSSKNNDHESTLETSSPTKFLWDFSKQKKFVYSFAQTTDGTTILGLDESKSETKMYLSGVGSLNVRVKENQLADVSITDLEMKMVTRFGTGSKQPDTISQTAPPMVVQDMKQNSSFENSNLNLLFYLVFPLPTKNLTKGGSEEIPMKMPFNAGGSMLYAKGVNKLTFQGYQELEGRKCTVMKGEIDISDLDIPEELKGEFVCETKGKATYYFDTNSRCYVGSDIELSMEMLMDTTTEEKNGLSTFSSIKNNSTYKIRLIDIEE